MRHHSDVLHCGNKEERSESAALLNSVSDSLLQAIVQMIYIDNYVHGDLHSGKKILCVCCVFGSVASGCW